MNGRSIHKKHNAEDVCLKACPVGRCPKARLGVIAFHHARFSMQLACFQNNALILAFGHCQNL